MTIHAFVERLVVDSRLGLDPRSLEAAVTEGLSRVLSQQTAMQLLQVGGDVDVLRATLQLEGASSTWGAQVGAAVNAAFVGSAAAASDSTEGQR